MPDPAPPASADPSFLPHPSVRVLHQNESLAKEHQTQCWFGICSPPSFFLPFTLIRALFPPYAHRKRPVWYGIFALYIAGGVIDFAAYGLAPLSLLAPVATLTIVINALLARAVFGEQLTIRDALGSAVIIVAAGTATAVGSRAGAEGVDLDDLIALW
jgi:drug/metabolite transporter (DMT)-like permease